MRASMLVVALLLFVPAAGDAKVERVPWLLFPVDLRGFEHVSSRFGPRRLDGHKSLHRGVDLVAPRGALVVAAREGRIADTGRAKACGWYVSIEHANSWHTIYCHLKSDPRRIGIVPGLAVPVQGVVGEVGSTGHSTGPHLHFTLLDDRGQAHDPLLALFTPAETLGLLRKMGRAR
jgi:murein DD-endopeptidase MepM/ murein hydrolase activator NlpD